MSAARLREAAARLRVLTDGTTPGPTLDRYDNGGGRLAVFEGRRRLVADFYGEGNTDFFATWSPPVARSLASLLLGVADTWPAQAPAVRLFAISMADAILLPDQDDA